MAIALACFAIIVRFIGPHYLFPGVADYPVVPIVTVLMAAGALLDWYRGRLQVRIGVVHGLLALYFLWAIVSLWLAAGGAEARAFLSSEVAKDVFFIFILMFIMDRMSRFKAVAASMLLGLAFVGVFGLPQLWSERFCGELQQGEAFDMYFHERPCTRTAECYVGLRDMPNPFKGVGERHMRCERRGPFGINAYHGRLRWVGVLSSTNSLAATLAFVSPLIFAFFLSGGGVRRRLLMFAAVGLAAAMLFATGSRGQQLAFAVGTLVGAFMLFGRRALGAAVVVGVLLGVSTFATKEIGLRGERDAASSTQARLDAGTSAFEVWGQYPLFGVGFNRFNRLNPLETHNTYLQAAVDLGLVGLTPFALLLWMSTKAMLLVFARARRDGDQDLRRWSAFMLGAHASVMMTLLFASWAASLLWMLELSLVNGFVRGAQRELEGLRVSIGPWDVLAATTAQLLLLGLTYVAMMALVTFPSA